MGLAPKFNGATIPLLKRNPDNVKPACEVRAMRHSTQGIAPRRCAPRSKGPAHEIPQPRTQPAEGLGAVPGHDDVRRPDRAGRGAAHRRACPRRTASTSSTPPTSIRSAPPRAMVGELLNGAARHEWILATKVGNKMSERPNETRLFARLGAARVRGEPEAARHRPHRHLLPAPRLQRHRLEEPLRAIDDAAARRQDPLLGRLQLPRLAHRRGGARGAAAQHAGPVVCQPYYNLLNRQPEVEVLPACAAPRHRRRALQPDRARRARRASTRPAPAGAGTRAGRGDERMMQTEFREESLRAAQTLKAHCEQKGVALSHFATAWVLAHRAVSAVIAGPRTFAAVAGLPRRARVRHRRRRRGAGRRPGRAGSSVDPGLQRPGLSAAAASRLRPMVLPFIMRCER